MLDLKKSGGRFFAQSWGALFFLLVCRLVANYYIPLNDTTEARYGEIARKMLETGNWVTLQQDYGVPFWAKPPLSTWFSALSMKCLGVSEFAARFPSLLFSLLVLWLVARVVRQHSGYFASWVVTLVLAGTLYFFIDAGAVMTEPALVFCTTLALVAFWQAFSVPYCTIGNDFAKVNKRVIHNRVWSYLFFVALGLGLLAKGPIAVILVGLPLFFWIMLRGEWVAVWQRFPWFVGTLLVLFIALPWYILAERRTPGFLHYFIWGEHIQRFLTPGWTGDKYGVAHHAAKGMIWLYAFAGVFPWCIVAVMSLLKQGKKIRRVWPDEDGWMSYWLLAMVLPLGFFTFASNIIYPYVFPSIPAFAILFSEVWVRLNKDRIEQSLWIPRCAMLCGLIALLVTGLFLLKPHLLAHSQKSTIMAWLKQQPKSTSPLFSWEHSAEFSAQFYSAGQVKVIANGNELKQRLLVNKVIYLIIDHQEAARLSPKILADCDLVHVEQLRKNKVLLFRCATPR